MRDIGRRRIFIATLAASTLVPTVLLILPIRSQGRQRSASVELATVLQLQAPSNPPPQPGSATSSNAAQALPSGTSDEGLGVTVVLDPAHGGADFGARGPTGLAESDVVLDFARAARIALEAQRLRVLLTREGNQNPSFDNRSAMVNGLHNAVLISLHVSSSGPVGTVRTYYYSFPSDPRAAETPSANGRAPGQTSAPPAAASQATPRTTLMEWDHAQRSSIDLSRQLATLAQTELVRRFRGSPDTPIAAPVRQLRTVAAPAIAIELSSIDVTDAKRLDQMAQPLADAIGRAVAEFHYPVSAPTAQNTPAAPNSPAATPSGVH